MPSQWRTRLALVLAVALGSVLSCQAQACSVGWGRVNGVCQQCKPGSKRAITDPEVCIPCGPGTYSPGAASIGCTPCPVNLFSADWGAAACTACPAGSIPKTNAGAIGQQGSTYCDPCGPGTVNATVSPRTWDTCELCPSGTYRPGDASPLNNECLKIPAGYREKTGTGVLPRTAYVPCERGQVSFWQGSTRTPLNGTTCQPCTADSKYAPRQGMGACIRCPAGTFPTDSNTALPGNDQCTKCPGITYRPLSSDSATCLPCTAGREVAGSGNSACNPCQPGYFNPASDGTTDDLTKNAKFATCQPCPINQYQPEYGKTSCLQCPAGKSTQGTGSSACVDCRPGYYSPKPEAPCIPSPKGTFVDRAGASNYKLCEPGTFGSLRAMTACEMCGAGEYSSMQGSQSCKSCPAGTYSKAKAEACTSCPAGYISNPSSAYCIACKAGTYSPGPGASSCGQCPTGNQCPSVAMTTPQPCRKGYFANKTGNILCLPCRENTFTNTTGQVTCMTCPAGTTTLGRTGQSACQPQRPTSLRRLLGRVLRRLF